MAIKVKLDRYTATVEVVLTVLQSERVFLPNGQYLVNASMAVNGIVKLNNKSEVARSPIKTFRAYFLSSRLRAMATRTRILPMAATLTRME
jgi:hypothetical protein